jgi:hypothetical protein
VSRAEPVTRGTQVIENFSVSPDGTWLAFDSDRAGTQQIYRARLDGGEAEQLTAGDEPAFNPSISPDGHEIAYHGFRGGRRQVFVIPAEGGTPTQVTAGRAHNMAPQWSPDGRTLTMASAALTPARELALVTRDAKGRWGAPRTLRKLGSGGIWAPDGRSVIAGITGRRGVGFTLSLEIVPVGGGEPHVVMSVRDPATDIAPLAYAWSPDGRAVYLVGWDPRTQSIAGIWRVPAAGGVPRLVVRFDDPTRPPHRSGFQVHRGRFYFTLGDQQSDIWMTEVKGSR